MHFILKRLCQWTKSLPGNPGHRSIWLPTSLSDYFERMRGTQHYKYEKRPPSPPLVWAFYSGFGSFLAIAIVGIIEKYGPAIKNNHLPFAIAPAGASAVLIFGVPSSPLSQPRNVIVGHIIAALVGTFMRQLFIRASSSFEWMPGALAVGISVGLMGLTNCYHPPAGATAFMAGYSSPEAKRVGWWFPIFPILALALILLALGLLFNNLARIYPIYWFTATHYTRHGQKKIAESSRDNGGSDKTMDNGTSTANSTATSIDISVGFPSPISNSGESTEQYVNDVASNEADADRAWMYARIRELEAAVWRLKQRDPLAQLGSRQGVIQHPRIAADLTLPEL